ncbi:MAG: sensor histidine kinase [Bacilli bacterium]|nr:sensor histidine kinase [Bacilli bacterium]
MTEIALYLLDLAQNSIHAEAKTLTITIHEDTLHNEFRLTLTDDGKGMDENTLKDVTSPFYTTRTTRQVGLGLAFIKELCDACNGSLTITSVLHKGTTVDAILKYDHIDRPPLGEIEETLYSLMLQKVRIIYHHYKNQNLFTFDSEEIQTILGNVSFQEVDVMHWIKDYITEQIALLAHTEEL